MNPIAAWVENAPDMRSRAMREAIHIILVSIANSADLQPEMIIKGGILLAIRYATGRFTRDVDFSTTQTFSEFDEGKFIATFQTNLIQASNQLPYQLECRLQTHEVKPNRDGTFPTMKIRVGYAYKSDRNALTRLLKHQAADVVQIDYSFNETIHDIDILDVDGQEGIKAYGETTLIAEKLRAILQQAVRNRARRQDIFDLHYLLSKYPLDVDRKPLILQAFLQKCRSRGIEPAPTAFDDPDLRERSSREYATLADDVEDPLPPFDVAFKVVQDFYVSLPWLKQQDNGM